MPTVYNGGLLFGLGLHLDIGHCQPRSGAYRPSHLIAEPYHYPHPTDS
jgi:hypothetical protein